VSRACTATAVPYTCSSRTMDTLQHMHKGQRSSTKTHRLSSIGPSAEAAFWLSIRCYSTGHQTYTHAQLKRVVSLLN
jgi:hypothetical protein